MHFKESDYKYRSYFLRFMTKRLKQILAGAVVIQKEDWPGVTTHFSEIIKRQYF